ncbi:MAG: DUF3015 family protein [Proteobacteria bacterium]|jgi:hypothetical protein|nr:DUF3015 family protein [Pseudomonadota bacterium]
MKNLVAFFAVSMICVSAFAQNGLQGTGRYGMAGCGLGSMAFGENTKFNQVLAATTNGTFGTQTFGISSGTSNCTTGGLAKIEKETEMFVEVNYDVLQKEVSQGKGETLASFSNLLGCSDSKVLGKGLQSNYKNISAAKNSSEFLNNVKTTISNNSALSTSCKTVATR